ncbi:glycosyltransferase family 2 protein [Burkholderia multivorans]|uniref:glycosyltransferase family 2 protein n=1 Tax=Burkholderia multivorans TaxID=87883 RepID=UPI001C237F0D|nr:glycosyltransferase family 2 protein [Burkholderia multivorans]MBU9416126.1 glycosyltransferase family 2 protein [Burkholderia multivorans]
MERSAADGLKIGVAAIFKNECEFILEWIAYHRVIGVDYFIISDNESTDGSRELLAKLEKIGLVKLIEFPNPPGLRPQLPAYSTMLTECPETIDVLAFIDADEFMFPLDGEDSVRPFFEHIFADTEVSALALNWAIYGSSGHVFSRDGLVIDRFTKMAEMNFGVNNHYKSVVRPSRVEYFENPHHAKLKGGRYVDARGTDVVYHEKYGHGLSNDVVWKGVRINHYAVKSLEEFLVGKSRKGSASRELRVKHEAYFRRHDKNDVEFLVPKALREKITVEIAEIQERLQSVGDEVNSRDQIGERDGFWRKLIGLIGRNGQ